MQDFRRLEVWERAHVLTLEVRRVSEKFPRQETYGLAAQVRRASASIGANIAEGACRKGDPEFARLLQIAFGSASELEYELLLTKDLGLLQISDHSRLSARVTEVKKKLASLISKLRADS